MTVPTSITIHASLTPSAEIDARLLEVLGGIVVRYGIGDHSVLLTPKQARESAAKLLAAADEADTKNALATAGIDTRAGIAG